MTHPKHLARSLIAILAIFVSASYLLNAQLFATPTIYVTSLFIGVSCASAIVLVELLCRRLSLRIFNVTILGLLIGYLLGITLLHIFQTIVEISFFETSALAISLFKMVLLLFSLYLGMQLTYRYSEEFFLTIPFVKLQQEVKRSKEMVVDTSALMDGRIFDLASSGLLDKRLVLPRFVILELNKQEVHASESLLYPAKRALEMIKKMEALSHLELRYQDDDFPELATVQEKTLHLAELLGADLLTADATQPPPSEIKGVRAINLHALSKALQPLMQHGELLKIRIQRVGKEEKQGVGYLEDGTMVVINGGGDFIGEQIDTRVLSVKHTPSGRMIFCNMIG